MAFVRRAWWTAKMQGDPQSCVGGKAADHLAPEEGLRVLVFKGSPGAILAEGPEEAVDRFTWYLRKLPWKALRWVADDKVAEGDLCIAADRAVTVLDCADAGPAGEGRQCDREKLRDAFRSSHACDVLLEELQSGAKGKGKGKGKNHGLTGPGQGGARAEHAAKEVAPGDGSSEKPPKAARWNKKNPRVTLPDAGPRPVLAA